jgi:hypothetical protein
MIEWNTYQLERIYRTDRHGKQKLDGHREVFVGTILADDKTEAQLIAGALYGSHAFVCSKVSDVLTPARVVGCL